MQLRWRFEAESPLHRKNKTNTFIKDQKIPARILFFKSHIKKEGI